MNAATAIVLAALALAVFFALRSIRKNHRSGCAGNCASCSKSCARK